MGCSHKPTSVYIDLDKCTKTEKKIIPSYSPVTVSFPSQKLKTPSLQSDNTFIMANEKRLKDIKEIINENLEKSFQSLLKELEEIYLQELSQFNKEQKEEIKDNKEKWSQDKYSKVRDIFMRYAPQHGKNLWKLAFIAGFPEPENYLTDQLIKTKSDKLKKQEVNELIEKNKELDSSFRKDIENLVNEIKLYDKKLRDQLINSIEERRKRAHQKASNHAESIIKDIKIQIKDIKKTDYSLRLPAIKEKNLNFSAVKNRIDFGFQPQIISTNDKGLCRIQSQIWSKSCGYHLTFDPNKGINKTLEFLIWKKKYELETLSNR